MRENVCFEDTLCADAGFNKHAFLLPEGIPSSPRRVTPRGQHHSQLSPICLGQIYMAWYGWDFYSKTARAEGSPNPLITICGDGTEMTSEGGKKIIPPNLSKINGNYLISSSKCKFQKKKKKKQRSPRCNFTGSRASVSHWRRKESCGWLLAGKKLPRHLDTA